MVQCFDGLRITANGFSVVRPEPVEGRTLRDNGRSGFDKLSINGLGIDEMSCVQRRY
jgi:hypothetical protein